MDIAPNAPCPQFWEMRRMSLLLSHVLEHALIFPFTRAKYIENASCGLTFPHIPMSMFLHLPLLKASDLIGLVTIHDSFTNDDTSSTLPEETTPLKQFFRAQEILEPCGSFGREERDKSKTAGDILTLFSLPFITGHRSDVLMDFSKQKYWLKLWFRCQEPWLIRGTMVSHQIPLLFRNFYKQTPPVEAFIAGTEWWVMFEFKRFLRALWLR